MKLRGWNMKTKTGIRRIRFPAPCDDELVERLQLVLGEAEEAPCNEYIVMSQEREMPALQEYLHDLHELGSQTIH